jgi:putative ABC transport system substrate-binding protein
VLCLSAEAQESKKVYRIGVLLAPSRSSVSESLDAFREGLHELGYVEGQNIIIEDRYAEGNFKRLPDLADQLVRIKVEVIVAAGGAPAYLAATNATSTIPIVATGLSDLSTELISSFAHPGGHITGLSLGGPELYGKRLELLKETVPDVHRVAVLLDPTNPRSYSSFLKEVRTAAQPMGLQVQPFEVRGANELEGAFKASVKGHADALTVGSQAVFTDNRKQIVGFAAKNHLPAIYPWREYVNDGGLMSYAPKLPDLYRRAAVYVDKILKGAKPGDLPVQQPTKYELSINLKTAKQIGVTIPPNVLARADKVIR